MAPDTVSPLPEFPMIRGGSQAACDFSVNLPACKYRLDSLSDSVGHKKLSFAERFFNHGRAKDNHFGNGAPDFGIQVTFSPQQLRFNRRDRT